MNMPLLKRRREILLQILVPPLIAILVAITLYKTDFLTTYENRLYDLHYVLRGNVPPTDEVVIVAIDDDSLNRLGVWPWPRERLAELIGLVKDGQPRAVGLDILVDLPEADAGDGHGDSALAATLSSPPVTVLPMVLGHARTRIDGSPATLISPLPEFVSEHSWKAAVNIKPDPSDGRVRSYSAMPGGDHLSFPVALLLAAQNLEPHAVQVNGEILHIGKYSIPLEKSDALINYTGSRLDAISAADVLEGFVDPSLFFQNRIVLIGRTDRASKDFMNTPVPGPDLFSTEMLAGVEIWKEALDTILQKRSIQSPPLLPVIFVIVAASLALSALTFLFPRMNGIFLLLFIMAWLVTAHTVFRSDHVRLQITPGVMSFYFTSILSFVRLYLLQTRLKRLLTTAFESYVSPHVLAGILSNRIQLAVGGERKELTILFADIKGFTSYSEEQPAEDVVAYLRTYFAEMNSVILDHGGIIDKLMGDGILAFFGDIDETGEHAAQAVRAALDMQNRMDVLREQGAPDLQIRIGIHTGLVVVGNVGSDRHFEYTVIGRNVNYAQRLEAACEPGGVLVSEATWDLVKNVAEASEPLPLTLKGIAAHQTGRQIRKLQEK